MRWIASLTDAMAVYMQGSASGLCSQELQCVFLSPTIFHHQMKSAFKSNGAQDFCWDITLLNSFHNYTSKCNLTVDYGKKIIFLSWKRSNYREFYTDTCNERFYIVRNATSVEPFFFKAHIQPPNQPCQQIGKICRIRVTRISTASCRLVPF